MPRIAVLDPAWADYVSILRDHSLTVPGFGRPAELVSAAHECEILLGAPDLVLRALPDLPALRWVQSTWAGVERFTAADLPETLVVTRAADVFGPAMREFVVGYLLEHTLDVSSRRRAMSWNSRPPPLLADTTVGIMGTGSIGRAVAETVGVFGARVRGYSRSGRPVDGFEQVYRQDDLRAFADGLHHLVVVLPATPDTASVVDRRLIAGLAPGATVINVGRGQSVVTADVVAALRSGHLANAVLDVLPDEPLPTGDPLWSEPNLIITSHSAAFSRPVDIVPLFLENLGRFDRGDDLVGAVDFEAGY